MPSHRNDISYYIFTWDAILANWMSGVILSRYMWYIFGRFKNICLHSKQTWSIKLNENHLWSGKNSLFRMLCPVTQPSNVTHPHDIREWTRIEKARLEIRPDLFFSMNFMIFLSQKLYFLITWSILKKIFPTRILENV